MKETTFESRAKEAFGDVYGKIKELEDKAKHLRAQLDEQKVQDTYQGVKLSSKAAIQDIRQGVEQASVALNEAIKKASHHFKK